MEEINLKVESMMCEGCENRVKKVVGAIDGVAEVEASHTKGIVNIKTSKEVSKEEIKEAIEDLGYEVK